MSYLLFYSNYCKHSKTFINKLEKYGLSDNFIKIPVDKRDEHQSVIKGYGITKVPTIVAENRKYVGSNAFKWLDSRSPRDSVQTRLNKVNVRDHRDPHNTVQGFDPSHQENFAALGSNPLIYTPPDNDDFQAQVSDFRLDETPLAPVIQESDYNGDKQDKGQMAVAKYEELVKLRQQENLKLPQRF